MPFFDCIRFFVGVFVSFAVDVEDGSSALIGLISLHPVGALSYGLQVIGTLEDQDIGLQGNTLGSSDTSSGWTVENSVQYFLIDTLIYGFLVSVSFAFTWFSTWMSTQLLMCLTDLVSQSHRQTRQWSVSAFLVPIYSSLLASELRTSSRWRFRPVRRRNPLFSPI